MCVWALYRMAFGQGRSVAQALTPSSSSLSSFSPRCYNFFPSQPCTRQELRFVRIYPEICLSFVDPEQVSSINHTQGIYDISLNSLLASPAKRHIASLKHLHLLRDLEDNRPINLRVRPINLSGRPYSQTRAV